MKFNKKLKKGFTLVELIVVIAIVAILAAVSVVSYIAFINSANESADVQLVKQLNIALQADQSLNGPRDTMHEMLGAMEENGFVVENLTKTKSGYDIVWDQEHNRFALLNGENLVYGESTYNSAKAWNIWKFADTEDEAKNKSYSVYLTEAFGDAASLNVSSGLDVGNNVISTINYNDADHPQTVVIRTNSFKTDIDINESTGDTIKHYGIANKLTTTHLTTNSYHEYGKLIIAFITEGRVVAEDKGVIEIAYVSSETAYAQEKDSGVINLAYASSSTVKTASDTPDTVNGVKKELIYETSVTTETVGNIVARIGATGYTTLEQAFAAVTENGVIDLVKDIESNHGFLYNKSFTSTLDLNGYTLKVTGSVSGTDGGRAIKITSGKLIAKNGVVDGRSYNNDGTPHDNPSSNSPWSPTRTGGCFRLSGGDAELENLVMYNNDGWGNCVKMESENHLVMRNCTVNSVYGAGLEQGYGTADLYNCTFTQTGLANSTYMSTCFAVCGLGTLNLHNVNASQVVNENNTGYGTYVLYVYNSGGIINIDGGTFISKAEAVIHVDAATKASFHGLHEGTEAEDNALFDAFTAAHDGKSSIVKINGGTFDGTLYATTGANANLALIQINGGTFSSIPTQDNIVDNRNR